MTSKYVILAALLAACQGREPDFRAARPSVVPLEAEAAFSDGIALTPLLLSLSPADGTTSFRGHPELVVQSDRLSPDDVEVLRSSLALVALPLGTAVDVRVEHVPPTLGTSEHRFVVVPETELVSGWYELDCDRATLGRLPMYNSRASDCTPQRFHVGALPLALTPSFAPDDDGIWVSLPLSERIADVRDHAEMVQVWSGGVQVTCRSHRSLGGPIIENPDLLLVHCASFELGEDVEVRIAADIRGVDGGTLRFAFDDHPLAVTLNPMYGGRLNTVDEVLPPVVERAERASRGAR